MLLSKYIPKQISAAVRPFYYKSKFISKFLHGGVRTVSYNRKLKAWNYTHKVSEKKFQFLVQAYRELKRSNEFIEEGSSILRQWVDGMREGAVFYDIGASCGHIGFFVGQKWNAQVVFVEPFTPSIQTILKTITFFDQNSLSSDGQYEVVHAAINNKNNYSKLLIHGLPIPGGTLNSFSDVQQYNTVAVGGKHDRVCSQISTTQWVAGVTVDSLWGEYGLAFPDYIKIDIDGFEVNAIEGALATLAKTKVDSLLIELNSEDCRNKVSATLGKFNYIRLAEEVHHPEDEKYKDYPVDVLFIHESRLDYWKHKILR